MTNADSGSLPCLVGRQAGMTGKVKTQYVILANARISEIADQ